MPEPLRVAYTLEQCWHRVPGGTAVAAIEVAKRLAVRTDVELIGVAGRHRHRPPAAFSSPIDLVALPLARPWLYETWNRFERPMIERATGAIDVCHSTSAIPAATSAPHVVTVHDVAFLATPRRFTRHGARVMRAGLDRCRRADLILCPSEATAVALDDAGFVRDRVRVVPWGVEAVPVDDLDRARVRARYGLPSGYVLFVGTLEPRKNLAALVDAVDRCGLGLPLVVAGASGWGDDDSTGQGNAHHLGFVPPDDLPALFAMATVFAYPSLEEGFGLPVAEAMAYGVPVVTSRGTATEDVAGGAAVLVEPTDVESIAAGLNDAADRSNQLRELGLERAAALSWDHTVDATVDAYRDVAR